MQLAPFKPGNRRTMTHSMMTVGWDGIGWHGMGWDGMGSNGTKLGTHSCDAGWLLEDCCGDEFPKVQHGSHGEAQDAEGCNGSCRPAVQGSFIVGSPGLAAQGVQCTADPQQEIEQEVEHLHCECGTVLYDGTSPYVDAVLYSMRTIGLLCDMGLLLAALFHMNVCRLATWMAHVF